MDPVLNIPLQQWYNAWLKEHKDGKTDLIYASPSNPQLHQVHFVRDNLAGLLWRDKEYDEVPDVEFLGEIDGRQQMLTHKDRVRVIGEHRSKSVRLPVFSITRPEHGLQLVLRYNFYDWNVSVVSERPVEMDMAGYGSEFSQEERERYPDGYSLQRAAEIGRAGYWGYLFFQGFPEEFWFGPHTHDKNRFSLSPVNDYELYSFVRTLSRLLIPSRRPK